MSQNETIEFSCPTCNTGLRIPIALAGVTGPCPHCQTSITAPHPAPVAAPVSQEQVAPQQQAPQQVPQQPAQPTQAAATTNEHPPEQASGATPQKREANSPAQPQSAPVERAQTQSSSQPKRKTWPALLFPILFLLLAFAVVYLILDLMGILKFGDKTPKVKEPTPITALPTEPTDTPPVKAIPVQTEEPLLIEPVPPTPDQTEVEPQPPIQGQPQLPIEDQPQPPAQPEPIQHDPQDVKKAGEVSSDLPDLAATKTTISVKKTTAAIKEAQEVLKRFLYAQNYEERKHLLTKSDRSDKDLASSSLGKPFPKSFEPNIITIRNRIEDRSFEVFFSVAFEQPKTERTRNVLVRTITYSEKDAPKIHTDPFIDLFEESPRHFQDSKQEGTATFNSIVGYSAYCFADIPKAKSMAKVQFYTNLDEIEKPIATAYLSKQSKAFKQLTDMVKAKQRVPATVSIAWDTETDPKRPFLQVIRIEAINWTL